jgi:hypothetical protein
MTVDSKLTTFTVNGIVEGRRETGDPVPVDVGVGRAPPDSVDESRAQ